MRLGQRQSDGCTLREHLLAAVQAGAPPDPALSAPPVPRGCGPLLTAFAALSAVRPQGLNGGGAIAPTEVQAWCNLHRVRLTPWELDTLTAMDHAALAVQAEFDRQAQKTRRH